MGIEERRLCIHCKHHVAPRYAPIECNHPELMRESPVDGAPHGKMCEWERSTVGNCGHGGAFYEAAK